MTSSLCDITVHIIVFLQLHFYIYHILCVQYFNCVFNNKTVKLPLSALFEQLRITQKNNANHLF